MLPADWQRRYKGRIVEQRPLAPLTSWRIGGPAQLFIEPANVEELVDTVRVLRRVGLPYRVLGGGSNLLVSDRGVAGAVLSLASLVRIEPAGAQRVWAEGGAKLHWLVRYAATCGLAGAECLAGIPGRVGGAVFGNAGGKYGDIGRLVRFLQVIDADGRVETIEPDADFFRYRGSQVGNRVVVRVLLELEPAPVNTIRRLSRVVIRERRATQPGWVGNAGCVFRNPTGSSAGRLIEEAGCKGLRVGGVYVSRQHANFMENDGGGTEGDVRRLIDDVRARVAKVHDVELEVEVRRWI